MCSTDSLTNEELKSLQPLSRPVRIQTANGIIVVHHYATVYVSDLDITVNMIVSKDAPLILSMGKLCHTMCDYSWNRGAMPKLTVYRGDVPVRTIHLELSRDCPICHASLPLERDGQPEGTDSTQLPPLPPVPAMPDVACEEEPDAPVNSPVPTVGGDVDQVDEASESSASRKARCKNKKKRKSIEEEKRSEVVCTPCDGSLEAHNKLTHHPKHPDCPICNGSKVQRAQCRKRSSKKSSKLRTPMPQATQFAHSVTRSPCSHTRRGRI